MLITMTEIQRDEVIAEHVNRIQNQPFLFHLHYI